MINLRPRFFFFHTLLFLWPWWCLWSLLPLPAFRSRDHTWQSAARIQVQGPHWKKNGWSPEEIWGPLYWVCFPSTLGGWAHTSVSIVHKQFQTECLMQPMSEGIVDNGYSSKASLKHSTKVQICTFSGYLYGYLKMLCPSLLPTYFILTRHSAQMLTLSVVFNISK